jgi:hypothetical protein
VSWTQVDLDAVDAAIAKAGATGVLEIEWPGGQKIRYHSLQAMLDLRSAIYDFLNQQKAQQSNIATTHSLASFR